MNWKYELEIVRFTQKYYLAKKNIIIEIHFDQ